MAALRALGVSAVLLDQIDSENSKFLPSNSMSKSIIKAFSLAGIVSVASQSQAATIVGVTIEDVSSEFFSGNRPAENVINGNGFTEVTGFHSAANGDNINWINDLDSGLPTITFDLGDNYDLNSVKIWNWNTSTTLTAGVNGFTISVADSEGGTFSSLGSFNLAQAPGVETTDFGEVISLSSLADTDDVRLVRFEVTSNHGFDFTLAGLSEVRFDGEAIPEPSSALFLSLASFGLLARRRYSK